MYENTQSRIFFFFHFFFRWNFILSRYSFPSRENICHKILIQTNYRHHCIRRRSHLSRVFAQVNFIPAINRQIFLHKCFFLFPIYFSFYGSRFFYIDFISEIQYSLFKSNIFIYFYLPIYLSVRTCYANLIFRPKNLTNSVFSLQNLDRYIHVFKHRLSSFFFT